MPKNKIPMLIKQAKNLMEIHSVLRSSRHCIIKSVAVTSSGSVVRTEMVMWVCRFTGKPFSCCVFILAEALAV